MKLTDEENKKVKQMSKDNQVDFIFERTMDMFIMERLISSGLLEEEAKKTEEF